MPARPFTFASGHEAHVPFHAANGREMLFPLRIKGTSRTLMFALDSGASVSYLDSGVARELGLAAASEGTVQGSGRETVHVAKIPDVAFDLAGLESNGHTVNATNLRPVQPEGEAMDGFLGGDFIERFVVTLDFANRMMTVADPRDFEYRGKGVVLPVTFRDSKPFVPGTIMVDGSLETAEFFVDSGSSDAVDHPAILKSMGRVRHIRMGNGLGEGSDDGVVGHADFFALGGVRMPGALTACCAPVEWQKNMFGTEVLRRFTVIFDYARRRIILEPNEHVRDPFPDN
jgi:Aspartyl protease